MITCPRAEGHNQRSRIAEPAKPSNECTALSMIPLHATKLAPQVLTKSLCIGGAMSTRKPKNIRAEPSGEH